MRCVGFLSRRELSREMHAAVQSKWISIEHGIERVKWLPHREHPVGIHDLGRGWRLQLHRRMWLHAHAHSLICRYGMVVEGIRVWSWACRVIARDFIQHVSRCIVFLLYIQEVSAGRATLEQVAGSDEKEPPTELLNVGAEGRRVVSRE